MKYVLLVLVGISIYSHAMEREKGIIHISDGNSEKDKSSEYQDSSFSNNLDFKDIELGNKKNTERVERRSNKGIVIDNSGKRLSVKLEIADLNNVQVLGIDLDDPKLHKQMVKDLLRIVLNDEEQYKKCKHAKAHIAKAIKSQLESPKTHSIKAQLDCVRKVSEAQLVTSRAEKISKRSRQQTYAGKQPSPRELYLQRSPHKNEEDFAELKDLVMQQLANQVFLNVIKSG